MPVFFGEQFRPVTGAIFQYGGEAVIMDLEQIIKCFVFEGQYSHAERYPFGRINDTYIVYSDLSSERKKRRYILQKINQNVFKEPAKVMENIERVTRHLRQKITGFGGDPRRETLNIVPTIDGNSYFCCHNGEYWRSYEYIEGTCSYQMVENPDHLYSAGRAVGRFQKLLEDFPAQTLYETIPDFHDTGKRFEAFEEAVSNDPFNRARASRAEIDFILKRKDGLSHLVNLLREGELPLRVIHNDTKFNNVLIDEITGKGICLVDLDTVMPGLSLYDFGDAIRFGTNRAGEEERDLSRVRLEMNLYEMFCRGYLEEVGNMLTLAELENLPFAARLITLECGIRFLTDYLKGDVYFKTRHEGQNLYRARTQFKLVEEMEAKYEQMEAAVRKYMNHIKPA